MAVERAYGGTSLIDVLDRILDKGLVIDVWARVSVVGLEVLTVEARVVVASVDTYLRYAQAIGLTPLASRPPVEPSQGQLDRAQRGDQPGLLSGVTGGQNGNGTGGVLQGVTGQLQGGNGGQQGGQQQALPAGLADQLRSLIQQLEGGQAQDGQQQAQPAAAGQGQ